MMNIIAIIEIIFQFLESFNAILLVLIILIFFQTYLFIKDRINLKKLQTFKDPEFDLNELENFPLVNFIVPAWNEGEILRDCLNSLKNLNYPNLKIIVNAGGSELTENIANYFKKYNNFIILKQKPGIGKIGALNEALDYITEGLVYMIDGDVIFNQEIFLRVIGPLINLDENVVSGSDIRPLKYQEDKYLPKYLEIRYIRFKKFERYLDKNIMGANCCLKYEVIKKIGKFSLNTFVAEDISRTIDIRKAGYEIYHLTSYKARLYHRFPENSAEAIDQRIRWLENSFFYSIQFKKSQLIRFIALIFISSIIIISPIFLVFYLNLFFISIIMICFLYLNIIRRVIIYKSLRTKKNKILNIKFYLLFFFYIYIESLVNLYVFFRVIFLRRKKIYEKRKESGKCQ